MLTFGLLVALTLATNGLQRADGAALDRERERQREQRLVTGSGPGEEEPDRRNRKLTLPPLEEERAALLLAIARCGSGPSTRPRDVAARRRCVRVILGGGSDALGHRQGTRGGPGDVSAVLVTGGGGGKPRLSRSLAALCSSSGGAIRYGQDVRDYIRWRCKNGYGQLMRRWGRSPTTTTAAATYDNNDDDIITTSGLGVRAAPSVSDSERLMRRYKMEATYRGKRDEADDMRAIVEAYREWRSQNGYGQTSGRWG